MLNDAWFLQYTINIIIYRFASNAAAQVKMRCQLSTALKLLHIQCLWSLGGATEKNVFALSLEAHGFESWWCYNHPWQWFQERKTGCTHWVGGRAYSISSVSHNDKSQSRVSLSSCMCDAAGWVHMVQESMCKSLTLLEGRCWLMVYVSSWKIVDVG